MVTPRDSRIFKPAGPRNRMHWRAGDKRPCARCGSMITVEIAMTMTSKYFCPMCRLRVHGTMEYRAALRRWAAIVEALCSPRA